MPSMDKEFELKVIMAAVHELAALAWPDETPPEAVRAIIDVQQAVCKALDLPEDLDLTDGTMFT